MAEILGRLEPLGPHVRSPGPFKGWAPGKEKEGKEEKGGRDHRRPQFSKCGCAADSALQITCVRQPLRSIDLFINRNNDSADVVQAETMNSLH